MTDAAEILQMVNSVQRCPDECSFYHVDLHVHSPKSHDFAKDVSDSNARKELRALDAVAFLQRAAIAGLELVAITDHHSGEFLDEALAASKTLSRRGTRIAVVPGVELLTAQGLHLTALLPSGGTREIHGLLSQLGLDVSDFGKEGSMIDRTVPQILELVHKSGGMLIGAHCASSDGGVIEVLNGRPRQDALAALDALELKPGSPKNDKTMRYVRDNLQCNLPFVYGSDSHDASFPSEVAWVKMARCDFASLQQVKYEPELRVSISIPPIPTHSRLRSLSIIGGLYANETFAFSSHLNVVIGGRGSGKSALIDLLRFVFESEPVEDDGRKLLRQRQADFLGPAALVVACVEAEGQGEFVLMRDGGFDDDLHSGISFRSPTEVYQRTAGGLARRQVSPSQLMAVEFFGQGEVFKLAERRREQLRLIDDNLDLVELNRAEEDVVQKILAVNKQLGTAEGKLARLDGETADEGKVRTRIAELETVLKDPVFADRSRWLAERSYLAAVDNWLEEAQLATADLESAPVLPPQSASSPSAGVLQRVAALPLDYSTARADNLSAIEAARLAAKRALEVATDSWRTTFGAADAAYKARLEELGATSQGAAGDELAGFRTKLHRIETEFKPEAQRQRNACVEFLAARSKLLTEVRSFRDKRDGERASKAEELNQQLQNAVRLEFTKGGDRSIFLSVLTAATEGSGMQKRDDQLGGIVRAISPGDLVTAIRDRDVPKLMAIGLTENNATRLLGRVSETVCRQLEETELPPTLQIQLKREGESTFTELSRLSVGEKCSAVLSVVLLDKTRPLVIDQPEDDLDHAFVTDAVVGSIRAVKHARQIITATHNPNIPVLGDAELVFRLARLPGRAACVVKLRGGLELPEIAAEVQMLEGGETAFERRRQRYAASRAH